MAELNRNLTENAKLVLRKRYLKKDDKGNSLESPEDLFKRVAENIASAEKLYGKNQNEIEKLQRKFYEAMVRLEFLPNSPCLMNAGRDLQQLSACFVLPIEDSMESIFETLKATALTHKTGGGTGFSFSKLRPKGSPVKTTSGIASGPVSFLKVFDAATQAVKQGGTRRGANMGILNVDHPDIMEFIQCKENDKEITNFNISVALTDDFMEKVEKNEEYELIDPRTKKPVKKINAREVFDLIVQMAWKNGEPGIVFIDRINKDNPTPKMGPIESTNPCVVGDSFISTEKGLMRIKDLVREYNKGGINIFTDDRVAEILYGNDNLGNVATKIKLGLSLQPVSAVFKTGIKPVWKITTKSGFEILATADHKIMTTKGWVKVEDLKVGQDTVLIQTGGGKFNYDDKLPSDIDEDIIEKKEYAGVQEVYDLTEPQTLTFISNGFISLDCGEQPILPYESCDLGSVNLSRMVREKDGKYQIDWNRLKETVKTAVNFLDDIIDVNRFPLERIEEVTKKNRKIGLGVMGFADMLVKLEIPYDSVKAVRIADVVMKFILDAANKKTHELAKEKGPFPNFKESIFARSTPRRNATLTTIAPTGSISIIAGCSSGIEPLFAISYFRNVMDNDKLVEVNPIFEDLAKKKGFYSRELMGKVAQKGTVQDIEEIPKEIRRIFVTALDIAPEWHVRMQAAFQRYTDNAVSKTINFPNTATVEDVKKAYLLAYREGCKGVTIYRDKSREEQVLNIQRKDVDKKTQTGLISPKPRPSITKGTTTKVQTGCGNLYVTINEDEDGKPFEIFTQMGKAGGCAASQLEAIGRLISLGFRSGIDLYSIIEQLSGIRCPSPSWEKSGRIFSCADAIAKIIERRTIDKKADENDSTNPPQENPTSALASPHLGRQHPGDEAGTVTKLINVVGVCPDCGAVLRFQEGCAVCRACGYSKC